MIAHASFVWEDVRIDAFNTGSGKDSIDGDCAIPECWGDMNAGTLETFFAEHQVQL